MRIERSILLDESKTRDITVEKAIESYRFGYSVSYDGDKHKIIYGTKCNRCGKYTWQDKIDYYCESCN